jgi:two-component system LytT family sensor kinase
MKQFKSFLGYWVSIFTIFFFLLLYSEKNESGNLDGKLQVFFFIISYSAIIAFILEFVKVKFVNDKWFWFKTIFLNLLINVLHSILYQLITVGDIESTHAIVFQSSLSTLILFALIVFRNYNLFKFKYVEFNFGWKQNTILIGKAILFFSIVTVPFYYDFYIDNYKLTDIKLYILQLIIYPIVSILLSYLVFYLFRNLKISNFIKILLCSILVLIFINFASLASVYIKHSNLFITLILNFFPASFILFYIFNSYHKRNELKKENLNLSVSKIQISQEYQELKNQINPHFLFNNLNTMISFIEENPKKAIAFGHHLAGVYRHYLKNSNEDFISLIDELSFIQNYLDIYKAKFNNSLEFTIPANILKSDYILSSVLQEIIDNIFKHNVIDAENIMKVDISKEDDLLVIKNSKVLKNKIDSTKMGLNNISKRYELLTNQKLIINDSDIAFEVQIPILKYED